MTVSFVDADLGVSAPFFVSGDSIEIAGLGPRGQAVAFAALSPGKISTVLPVAEIAAHLAFLADAPEEIALRVTLDYANNILPDAFEWMMPSVSMVEAAAVAQPAELTLLAVEDESEQRHQEHYLTR